MTFGASVTAHILNTDSANLKRWVMAGMPKEKRGRYHLPSCVKWRVTQLEQKLAGEEYDPDITKRRAALYESQESKNRIDIAERLAMLIPRDEVEQALATLAQVYVDTLESIPSRLDAEPAIIAAVTRECRAARGDVARAVRNAGQQLRAEREHTAATA